MMNDNPNNTAETLVNDPSQPTEQNTGKKTRGYGRIQEKMGAYADLLDNLTRVAEAAQAAKAIGFGEAELKQGQALLKEAQSQMEAQHVAWVRSKTLGKAVKNLRKEVDAQFMLHVKLARQSLPQDSSILGMLKAREMRKKKFDVWLFRAISFYNNLLDTEEAKAALLPYQITEKELKAAMKRVEELRELDYERQQQKQEARKATVLRDEAINKVHQWVSNFRKTARAHHFQHRDKSILLGL